MTTSGKLSLVADASGVAADAWGAAASSRAQAVSTLAAATATLLTIKARMKCFVRLTVRSPRLNPCPQLDADRPARVQAPPRVFTENSHRPQPRICGTSTTWREPAGGGCSTAATSAFVICASVTKPSRRAPARNPGTSSAHA